MFEVDKVIGDYGLYLKNCLTQEDIDYIVDASKSEVLEKGSSRLGTHTVIEHEDDAWNEALKLAKDIFAKIHPVMIKAMEVYCDHFALDINAYTMSKPVYWIKTYDIGANIGHHSDSWEADGDVMVPAISIILYLSSDFKGGELVFVDEVGKYQANKDVSIQPEAGNMAVFKSNIIHAVKPVISGTRISTDITYMK
jgi:predicted 2-oxoglutarate/Fe(II)-dependent dioxygenase YbiX